MKRTIKEIPKFKSESEEVEFWDTHDVTDYFDISKAKRVVFPNLKPSTETISLRLPVSLLHGIKNAANKNDVPYQSLMKLMLAERLKDILGRGKRISAFHGLGLK